ncbi:MAG: hypothetical protein PVG30_09300 [Gammaproteobacteria bacterium]
MKIEVHAYGLIGNKSTCSISEIFNGFKQNPRNRRESELLEATVFGKCVEVWCKQKLLITFVNEDKGRYKGIDFFLASSERPKNHHAFQLLQYQAKYCSVKNTDEFAQWVVEKKFLKGDDKVHLVVSIATKEAMYLDIASLKDKFKDSPYASVNLMSNIKTCDSLDVQQCIDWS